ncbi:hypothetical protein GC194_05345 [bacterium]|nr:hypothetical protein [bacterium]
MLAIRLYRLLLVGAIVCCSGLQAMAQTTVIPFSRAGNLIIVSGKIGNETGNFILDTGAPYLVLNETYFNGESETAQRAGGINGNTERKTTVVDTLAIMGHQWVDVEADVVSLAAVENSKNIKILGLLGVALFQEYELTINYALSQLYLSKMVKGVATDSLARLNTELLFTEKLQIRNNHLFVTINIGNKKLLTCIDSGAEACVLHNKQPDEVWENLEIKGRFVMSGVGGKTEVLRASIASMQLGDESIRNVQAVVTNLDNLSEAYGANLDCILGYTMLSGYVVTFNFVNKTVSFSRNV